MAFDDVMCAVSVPCIMPVIPRHATVSSESNLLHTFQADGCSPIDLDNCNEME